MVETISGRGRRGAIQLISFGGRCLLLDIEGTTSSVSFVYDQMFPEVRRRLNRFLADAWSDAEVQKACGQIAHDAGFESLAGWLGALGPAEAQRCVATEVIRQMDQDLKATGLKTLQGLIWRDSFERGVLQAHLYDDVLPAIESWVAAGRQVDIYSSGSLAAQRLFFGHTIHGNLLPMLSHHFDTTIGSKREGDSYGRIASQLGWQPAEILFLSDVVAELDAARSAGLQTVLCQRPGNSPVPDGHGHAQITSFAQIELVGG